MGDFERASMGKEFPIGFDSVDGVKGGSIGTIVTRARTSIVPTRFVIPDSLKGGFEIIRIVNGGEDILVADISGRLNLPNASPISKGSDIIIYARNLGRLPRRFLACIIGEIV